MSTLDAENLLRGKFNSALSPINTKHLNTICSDKNFLNQFIATKSMIDENQETEEFMPKLRPKDGISEKPYMSMEESTYKGFPLSMVEDIERRFGSKLGEKRGSVVKQYLWNSNFKKKLGGNENSHSSKLLKTMNKTVFANQSLMHTRNQSFAENAAAKNQVFEDFKGIVIANEPLVKYVQNKKLGPPPGKIKNHNEIRMYHRNIVSPSCRRQIRKMSPWSGVRKKIETKEK
jgi:hypothetical protein